MGVIIWIKWGQIGLSAISTGGFLGVLISNKQILLCAGGLCSTALLALTSYLKDYGFAGFPISDGRLMDFLIYGDKKMLLNQPLKLKNIILRNRIVMPPMATGKSIDGVPGDVLIDYYKVRAKATALIILEHEYVSTDGMASIGQLSMADDGVIDSYKNLTAAVCSQQAVILAQINHAGAAARYTGLPIIAPSPIVLYDKQPVPHEMTKKDIAVVIKSFTDAALRAKKAGFDGVEIHSAHGYLLNQFYSPLTNKRTDEYCGTALEGRTRIHTEIIHEVRKATGEDFIIALRFGACDYMEGGSKVDEVAAASGIFEEAGIDLLDISGGHCGYTVDTKTQSGWFSELSAEAKKAVKVPVILTGGITSGEEAEKLLKENVADLIGVGRAVMQNASWAQEALAALK